jgi:hypothetical protein
MPVQGLVPSTNEARLGHGRREWSGEATPELSYMQPGLSLEA